MDLVKRTLFLICFGSAGFWLRVVLGSFWIGRGSKLCWGCLFFVASVEYEDVSSEFDECGAGLLGGFGGYGLGGFGFQCGF